MRTISSATATGVSGSVLAGLAYCYDENPNPTSMTDQDGNQSIFSYDSLDRLTQEAHPEKTLSYTYDPAGNRKTKTDGTTTASYAFDAERITQAGSTIFAHDNNGNMTSRTEDGTTTEYAYDFQDRLVQAGEKTYERDANGREGWFPRPKGAPRPTTSSTGPRS